MSLKKIFFLCTLFFTYSFLLSSDNILDTAVKSFGSLLKEKQINKEDGLTNQLVELLNINQKKTDEVEEKFLESFELLKKYYSKNNKSDNCSANSEVEEYYKRKNEQFKSGSRNLLLRVIIPVGVIVFVFCLLCSNYKAKFLQIWDSIKSVFSLNILSGIKKIWNFCKAVAQSHRMQSIEMAFALLRIFSVGGKANYGGKANTFLLGLVRIAGSIMFIINKNQYSTDFFNEGSYFCWGWLLFDIYNLVKIAYNDFVSAKPKKEKDIQFEQFGKTISLYLCPILETLAALGLSLNIGESAEAIKIRKDSQIIYSLLRLLPVYLEAKSNSVDALLSLHVLMIILDFGGYFKGGFAKKNMWGINFPFFGQKCEDEDGSDDKVESEKEAEPEAPEEGEDDLENSMPPESSPEDKPAEEATSDVNFDENIQDRPGNPDDKVENVNIEKSEQPDRERVVNGVGSGLSEKVQIIFGKDSKVFVDNGNLSGLEEWLNYLIERNPEIAEKLETIINESAALELSGENSSLSDPRSIRDILEEKLSSVERLNQIQ